ncbi:MAG TPA: hypothetical protein ENK57_06875 [Polyangiaceae bacterium]|nr:hypothetical protein [Polyangiaceae bacterium]
MTQNHTIERRAGLLALAALLVACGGDETAEPHPEPQGSAAFTPDAQGEGPRLWLEAEREGERSLVTLHGSELGEIFGWSVHLRFDDALVAIESGDIAPDALGSTEDVMPLAVARPADLVLAATRRDPLLGGIAIAEPTPLATAVLTDVAHGKGRLELTNVVVRRVDGSYVAVVAHGGSLDTTGGAP